MKFKSTFFFLGTLLVWGLLTSTLRNPNNPPLGNTGAPNETTCAKSGCHLNPGTITGTVAISGIPDTVSPNQTYTITLTNTSNAAKAGFQLTCLDGANAKCGTLTAGTGSNVGTFSARQYVRQSSAKNLTGGSASWTFTWKAPATLTGDSIKFYFVSLAANGNGNNGGDNVLRSSKKVIFQPTSASHEAEDAALVQMYPNPAVRFVQIKLPTVAEGKLSLYNAAGKMVLEQALISDNQLDVSELPRGMYLAKIQAGQKMVSRQITLIK